MKIRSFNNERLTAVSLARLSHIASDVSLQSNKKPARYHFAGSVCLGKQKRDPQRHRNVRRAYDFAPRTCSILDAAFSQRFSPSSLRLFHTRLLHALLIENRSSPLPSLPSRGLCYAFQLRRFA